MAAQVGTRFLSVGITIQRVMLDSGACNVSKLFAKGCKTLGVKHS